MIKNNNNFVNESLSLYKELCTPITSRELFFNDCVQNRLDYLLNSNSNQMDDTITRLEHYLDGIIVENSPYVRCDNYKRMRKTCIKSNSNYILKLFKSYNKSYLMSTKLLRQLVKKL